MGILPLRAFIEFVSMVILKMSLANKLILVYLFSISKQKLSFKTYLLQVYLHYFLPRDVLLLS
jgi:hypothetical protein